MSDAERDGAEVARLPLPSPPDLAVVDLLARILLAARRSGWTVRLVVASPEVLELLDLAGLRCLSSEEPP